MLKVKIEGLGSDTGFGWRIDPDDLPAFLKIIIDNGWEDITVSPVSEFEES